MSDCQNVRFGSHSSVSPLLLAPDKCRMPLLLIVALVSNNNNKSRVPIPRLLGNPPDSVRDFGGIADVNGQVVVGRRATYSYKRTVIAIHKRTHMEIQIHLYL
ncbi:uncharacterized protein DMAD_11612 [Drosophila madeirensis]|uniref:Uncharacterized protein n=1 Tax=Drosophila madeirensis TaxID=30013 RepID=A0AAU9FDX7_DROMD